MKPKSLELISEYCENKFFGCSSSKKLIILLPSVNGGNVYPYYPRISWSNELKKDFNLLYLSDPYQQLPQYSKAMGSWFISPYGESTLKVLADKLRNLIFEICADDVIFYGSSMGGYAAIMLSAMVDGSKAIAECPQLYLNKHPGSRFVCDNVLNDNIAVEEIEPLYYLEKCSSAHFHIVCSVFDRHYTQHVLPFIKDFSEKVDNDDLSLTLNAYFDPRYKKGHVALQKHDAFKVIRDVANKDSHLNAGEVLIIE